MHDSYLYTYLVCYARITDYLKTHSYVCTFDLHIVDGRVSDDIRTHPRVWVTIICLFTHLDSMHY